MILQFDLPSAPSHSKPQPARRRLSRMQRSGGQLIGVNNGWTTFTRHCLLHRPESSLSAFYMRQWRLWKGFLSKDWVIQFNWFRAMGLFHE